MFRYGIAAVTLAAAVVLAGCSTGPDEVNAGRVVAPTPAPTTSAPPTGAAATSSAGSTSGSGGHGGGGTARPAVSCTNRINYAGDPRSNAEINSIGERTGKCPPVQRPANPRPNPGGIPNDPAVSCTNRIDYAGDSRSNAEINSIGESTGFCPAPQH